MTAMLPPVVNGMTMRQPQYGLVDKALRARGSP